MPIRWGIIGCGDVVRKRVARAIQTDPDSLLLSACRRSEQPLREFCSQWKVERAFRDFRQLLADPEIDAVYIATPVDLHLPQTLAAAEAGKHVLVEKPMGLSAAECQEMIDACNRAGVRLGVAYYRRFYPVVQRMRQLLDAGEIGKPLAITAVTSTPFDLQPGDDGYWRVIPEQGGGGALMDIGSHRLELFIRLLGEIEEVKAYCDSVATHYKADSCTTVMARFRSGAHGVLQCFFGTTADPDELAILGTRGRLVSAPLNRGQLQLQLDSRQLLESHPPHENFSVPLIADFVAAIREKRSPAVCGRQGQAVNEVIDRAYGRSY